jgi:hypothetical protein
MANELIDATNKHPSKKASGGFFFKRDDISYSYQENGYVDRIYLDKSKSKKRKLYAIGDSVMLGASGALLKSFPCLNIDSKVGRGLIDVISVMDQAKSANITPEAYIVHIGNNEHLNQDKFRKLNTLINQNIKIIFLNLKLPRNYESSNNNEIKEFVEMHPDKVFLIDWRAYSLVYPGIFGKDGMHLSRSGVVEYAALIKRELVSLKIECTDES